MTTISKAKCYFPIMVGVGIAALSLTADLQQIVLRALYVVAVPLIAVRDLVSPIMGAIHDTLYAVFATDGSRKIVAIIAIFVSVYASLLCQFQSQITRVRQEIFDAFSERLLLDSTNEQRYQMAAAEYKNDMGEIDFGMTCKFLLIALIIHPAIYGFIYSRMLNDFASPDKSWGVLKSIEAFGLMANSGLIALMTTSMGLTLFLAVKGVMQSRAMCLLRKSFETKAYPA